MVYCSNSVTLLAIVIYCCGTACNGYLASNVNLNPQVQRIVLRVPKSRQTVLSSAAEHDLYSVSDKHLVEYGTMGNKKILTWNDETRSFKHHSESKFNLQHALHGHFFPSGELTSDYYRYASWRATQRLVSATNSVFGTQALLLALGFKKHRIGKILLLGL